MALGWYGASVTVRTPVGSAYCSGLVTATFSWNNLGNPDNKPPGGIVITELGEASWTGTSGSSSTGLGSIGVRRRVIGNPGQTFSITVSPSATANITGGGGAGGDSVSGKGSVTTNAGTTDGGTATVKYKLWYEQIWLRVDGAIESGGKYNALVGQNLNWRIDGVSPYTVTYNWTYQSSVGGVGTYVSSYHHDSWGSANEFHHVFGPPNGANALSTFPITFDAPGDIIPQCTMSITFNGQLIGSFTVTTLLQAWAPYYSYRYSEGYVDYRLPTGALYPDEVWATGAPFYPITGMYFDARVGTPTLFLGQGWGFFGFAQLTDYHASYMVTGIGLQGRHSGYMELDNVFPYSGVAVADSVGRPPGFTGIADDSPGIELLNGDIFYTTSFDLDFEFRMMLIYQPPPNNIQSPYNWVALHNLEWLMLANDSRDMTVDPNWGPESPGNLAVPGNEAFPTYKFQWDAKFVP